MKVQKIEDALNPSLNQNNLVEFALDAGVGIW